MIRSSNCFSSIHWFSSLHMYIYTTNKYQEYFFNYIIPIKSKHFQGFHFGKVVNRDESIVACAHAQGNLGNTERMAFFNVRFFNYLNLRWWYLRLMNVCSALSPAPREVTRLGYMISSSRLQYFQLEESKRSYIIRNQDKVYRFVHDLHNNQVTEQEMKHKLTNSGSRIGIMYSSPKAHKLNAPICPIFSTINSYNYSLSLNFL